MKIYHYTTIETLALILRNKTIRFNRLDKVDDVEEACYGSGPNGRNICKYQFVSCWNKDQQENIALWKMYTNYKGVRIGLDEEMFVTYDINDHCKSYFPFPFDLKENCLLLPINNEARLYEIHYVENFEDEIKSIVTQDKNSASINYEKLAFLKRKEWEFQKESRFRITVRPFKDEKIDWQKYNDWYSIGEEILNSMSEFLKEDIPINIEHFDIPLQEEKLKDIEVMMGPMTTEGDRILVEALLSSYKDSKISDSYFKGKIRK